MGVSRRKGRRQKQPQSHVVSKSLENVSYRKHFCFRNKIGLGFWAVLNYLDTIHNLDHVNQVI